MFMIGFLLLVLGSCDGGEQIFRRSLLYAPSRNCSDYSSPDDSPAVAILEPLNHTLITHANMRLVVCMKHVPAVGAISAWLHVVESSRESRSAESRSAESRSAESRSAESRSANPVRLGEEESRIEWQDVPAGNYEAFVEVLGADENLLLSSSRTFFKVESPARERPNLSPPRCGSDCESDEWPILKHVRAMARTRHSPKGEKGRRLMDQNVCGQDGWAPVSVNEVISSFLASEWYKAEHQGLHSPACSPSQPRYLFQPGRATSV